MGYARGNFQSRSKSKLRNQEYFIKNFLVRFLYEAFFELVLCSLINVSYLDDGAAGGFLSWMASLVTLIAAAGAIIFTLSLYCANGPYLKSKQYVKGSLLPSFWGIRQLNKELEITK